MGGKFVWGVSCDTSGKQCDLAVHEGSSSFLGMSSLSCRLEGGSPVRAGREWLHCEQMLMGHGEAH